MGSFQVIDIIFVILTALMVIHGFVMGFVKELFSWAASIISIVAAVFFHPYAAAIIRSRVMPDVRYVPEILGFLAVFLAVMLVCKIIERLFRDVVMGAQLSGIDKVFGALFGFAEGIVIAALVLFVLEVQPFFDASKIISSSVFAQILFPIIRRLPLNRGKEIIDIVQNVQLPGFYPRFWV